LNNDTQQCITYLDILPTCIKIYTSFFDTWAWAAQNRQQNTKYKKATDRVNRQEPT